MQHLADLLNLSVAEVAGHRGQTESRQTVPAAAPTPLSPLPPLSLYSTALVLFVEYSPQQKTMMKPHAHTKIREANTNTHTHKHKKEKHKKSL